MNFVNSNTEEKKQMKQTLTLTGKLDNPLNHFNDHSNCGKCAYVAKAEQNLKEDLDDIHEELKVT